MLCASISGCGRVCDDTLREGGNVFIIGLLSPTVLTMTPNDSRAEQMMLQAAIADTMQKTISTDSYTPKDIDAFVPRRGLVHLYGPARNTWTHAIRVGIDPISQMNSAFNVVEDGESEPRILSDLSETERVR